jgi:hypothetical protein
MKKPTFEGFFKPLEKLQNDEENWKLAPGREKRAGMKYPIVCSDDLIPFMRSVLEAHNFAYKHVCTTAKLTPGGVVQTLWYIVWNNLNGEAGPYHITWASPNTHNEQAGGLTRAHRRFLQGLTGFVEWDADGIKREERARAQPPVNVVGQDAGGAQHGSYQQAPNGNGRAPDPVTGATHSGLYGADHSNPVEHAPYNAGGNGPSGQALKFVDQLKNKGFDPGLASDLATAGPRGLEIALCQNGLDANLAARLVGFAKGDPFAYLPEQLDEDARHAVVSYYGDYERSAVAFQGTGWNGPATGETPNAIQWVAALLKCNFNNQATGATQATNPQRSAGPGPTPF